MFLTRRNFKYGVVDLSGKEVLPNIFDNFYMLERNKMRVRYEGAWYDLDLISEHQPREFTGDGDGGSFTITRIITNPLSVSGYSAVTGANYVLKLFSALSPSYEQTIDDLIYSQGADAVGILMRFSWLPRFPMTYAKNYYHNIKAPNTGPLNDLRDVLRSHIRAGD